MSTSILRYSREFVITVIVITEFDCNKVGGPPKSVQDGAAVLLTLRTTAGNTERGKCRLTNEYPFFLFLIGY